MRSRGIESEHRARCLGGAAWSSGCSFERIDLVRISDRAGDEGRGLPWPTPKGRSGTEQAQTSVPPKKRFSNRQSRLGTGWGSGSERSVCGEPTEGWQERRVWGHKIWAACRCCSWPLPGRVARLRLLLLVVGSSGRPPPAAAFHVPGLLLLCFPTAPDATRCRFVYLLVTDCRVLVIKAGAFSVSFPALSQVL